MSICPIRLHEGALVIYEDVYHKILSRDESGVSLRTLGAKPITVTKTHAEMAEAYFDEPRRLRLVVDETVGLPQGVQDNLLRSIETFDIRQQDAALTRLDYMQACDRLFAEGAYKKVPSGYAEIAKIVAAERRQRTVESEGVHPDDVPMERISGSSLKGWYTRWRKAGRALVALIPLDDRKGQAGFKLDPEVEQLISTRVREDWLTIQGPPLSHIIRFIEGDIERANGNRTLTLDIPDGMTIRRWVKANVSKYDEIYYREGKVAAEQAFRHVKRAPQATRPLEIVEIDHTPLDVLALDSDGTPTRDQRGKVKRTKRIWLTVAICAATRMIVGFHLSTERPSWTSVMHCLRMLALPKDLRRVRVLTAWPVFGIPEVVKLDNGTEFHSRSMKAAAGQLRFELRYMPRRTPHLKGKVERVIGTIARDFCAYLPGRTFRDVREKGDYDSVGQAALSLAQIVEFFMIWAVDIYHNRSHGGLLGRTPLQRWDDLKGYGVRLPPSAEDLFPLIALVVPRTIQRHGITFLGLRYQSDELKGIRRRVGFHFGEEFLVKVDAADLSHLLVLVDEKTGWIKVPCEEAIADGTSLAEWNDTVRTARRMTRKGQRVARSTLLKAMELLRAECRAAGAKHKPKPMSAVEIDWFRENADHPLFDVAWDLADEGAYAAERQRTRRPVEDARNPVEGVAAVPERRIGQGGRKAEAGAVADVAASESDRAAPKIGSALREPTPTWSTVAASLADEIDADDPDNWTAE